EAEIGEVVQVATNRHEPERPTVGIWFAARMVDPGARPQAGDDADEAGWFDPATPPPPAFPPDAPVPGPLAAGAPPPATTPRPRRGDAASSRGKSLGQDRSGL